MGEQLPLVRPGYNCFQKRVLMGSQNSGFALIFARLTPLQNLILIRCQDSKKPRLLYMGLNIFQFWIVIADVGMCPLKRDIDNGQDLPSRLDTMNFIECHLAFRMAAQILRDLWILSFGTSMASNVTYLLMILLYSQNPQKNILRG